MTRYPFSNTTDVQLTSTRAAKAAAELNEANVVLRDAMLKGGLDVERDDGLWLRRVNAIAEELETAHRASLKAAMLASELQAAFFAIYPR